MTLGESVVSGNTAPGEPDEALIARAVGGDDGAFATLYDAYHDRILRYVIYRVGTVEDAEDLTQKVFLQAWRALGRYRRTGSPFLAWLMTIAHNATVSFFRSRKPAETIECEPADWGPGTSPEAVAAARDEQEAIRRAVLRLKAEQQQVIAMRFLEGFDCREIAAAIGKTEGNVRVIQHRGLQQLRRLLEAGGVRSPGGERGSVDLEGLERGHADGTA